MVIPKEIRRTLRIREGDPLEIFTDREGEVILKKYSPIGELGDFASEYAESLHNTSGHIICVADRDSIIAVSGASKKEFLEKQLSTELEKIMESKSTFVAPSADSARINILNDDNEDKYSSQVITPIISEGDPIGAVMFLSTDPKAKMGGGNKTGSVGRNNFRKAYGTVRHGSRMAPFFSAQKHNKIHTITNSYY